MRGLFATTVFFTNVEAVSLQCDGCWRVERRVVTKTLNKSLFFFYYTGAIQVFVTDPSTVAKCLCCVISAG